MNKDRTILKTDYEKSIFVMNSIIDSIDKMVNKSMFDVCGEKPDQNIIFHRSEKHELFFILLVDFLSSFDSSIVNLSKRNTPLSNLLKIINENYLNLERKNSLEKALNIFKNWLEEKIEIEIWLSTIAKESIINLSRLEMIKACGTITKHNVGRLDIKFNEMVKIFKRTDESICKEDVILEYNEFHERFHDGILVYHSSYIVEMLINIRWSLYRYLKPVYEKSFYLVPNSKIGQYGFRIPKEINTKFMEIVFWELMNKLSREPYIKEIQITKYLKKRY